MFFQVIGILQKSSCFSQVRTFFKSFITISGTSFHNQVVTENIYVGNILCKILKEMGISGHLTCLLRNLYAGQEATVRSGHGTTDWFRLGKEYFKAVYCHPAYLTYMQSTSCKVLGWMKHKLKSRLLGEISTTSDMQMIPPLWQKVKRN